MEKPEPRRQVLTMERDQIKMKQRDPKRKMRAEPVNDSKKK